jgi:hypothetical protein
MSDELTYEKILELFKESEKRFKESERMLTEKFQETRLQFQESEKRFKESERTLTEKFQKTEKMISNLGTSVGGVIKSIGNITEGITFPSVTKELYKKFKAEYVTPNLEKHKKDDSIEIDIFAYSNSVRNEAFIVEVKTTLNNDALKQLEKNLKKFRGFFPEHNEKKLFGIISAVKATQTMIDKVYKRGFYFATVKDGLFKVEIPKGFTPKVY